MTKLVRIIRDTYTVTDDGHGGSVDVDHDTRTEETVCTGDPVPYFVSPVREAVETIRREYCGMLDGSAWFGQPEPYAHPYEDRQTETTAHLAGDWTDTERRQIARMVAWCENRDDQRARLALSGPMH